MLARNEPHCALHAVITIGSAVPQRILGVRYSGRRGPVPPSSSGSGSQDSRWVRGARAVVGARDPDRQRDPGGSGLKRDGRGEPTRAAHRRRSAGIGIRAPGSQEEVNDNGHDQLHGVDERSQNDCKGDCEEHQGDGGRGSRGKAPLIHSYCDRFVLTGASAASLIALGASWFWSLFHALTVRPETTSVKPTPDLSPVRYSRASKLL